MPKMTTTMFVGGLNVTSYVEMWHKQIGHISIQTLQNILRKNVVTGLPNLRACEMSKICEACQYGKQNKFPSLHEGHINKNRLVLVHTDVRVLTENASICGGRFYVTLRDDCSRKTWIYFMK